MIIAAAMDPKPEKLQQNIILKFRNLKVKTRKIYIFVCVALFYSRETNFLSREMEERNSAFFGVVSAAKSKNQCHYLHIEYG